MYREELMTLQALEQWCERHIGFPLKISISNETITNMRKMHAFNQIDEHIIQNGILNGKHSL